VLLEWQHPEHPNGLIRRYDVQISEDEKAWKNLNDTKNVNKTSLHASVRRCNVNILCIKYRHRMHTFLTLENISLPLELATGGLTLFLTIILLNQRISQKKFVFKGFRHKDAGL